jgi:transposase-like protein
MSQNRWTESEGSALVQQWRQSGMDKKSFCNSHGIGYARLLYWCKQFSDSDVFKRAAGPFRSLEVLPDAGNVEIRIKGLTVWYWS